MVEEKAAGSLSDRKEHLVNKVHQQWSKWLQIAVAVFQGMALDQLSLRSMSLSFASLLSMVPMLAFSFSVLKGFGVHNFLEPVLAEFMAPLGDGGADIAEHIIAFVENINVGVLGFAGLLILIYTVTGLVHKIENAFNYIWYVRKSRTMLERLRDYLSIILLGPLIIVSVIGLFGALQQASWVQQLYAVPVVGPMAVLLLKQVPVLLVFAAFTFFYAFIPNTRVDWRSALGGAVVAGILWLVVGWAFTQFAGSSAKYTAIYSGFAVMILFLIWLNLNWLLILIGSAIAFYLQYPAYLRISRERQLMPSPSVVERAVLQAMVWIVRDHRRGLVHWDNARLARSLNLPHTLVGRLTVGLMNAGMLVKTTGRSGYYVPGKASECMPLTDILQATHAAGDHFRRLFIETTVQEVFEQLEGAQKDILVGRSLADLVDLTERADETN